MVNTLFQLLLLAYTLQLLGRDPAPGPCWGTSVPRLRFVLQIKFPATPLIQGERPTLHGDDKTYKHWLLDIRALSRSSLCPPSYNYLGCFIAAARSDFEPNRSVPLRYFFLSIIGRLR